MQVALLLLVAALVKGLLSNLRAIPREARRVLMALPGKVRPVLNLLAYASCLSLTRTEPRAPPQLMFNTASKTFARQIQASASRSPTFVVMMLGALGTLPIMLLLIFLFLLLVVMALNSDLTLSLGSIGVVGVTVLKQVGIFLSTVSFAMDSYPYVVS